MTTARQARPAGGTAVGSASDARAHAEATVRAHWDAEGRTPHHQDMIDLSLVVSELVTNAIRHGAGLAGFDARPTEEGVRIAVHDHSDVIPEAAGGTGALPDVHRGSGYGWPLVIRLARDIEVRRRPGGGKTVSVLVPLRDAPS
ncbi:ATP-binding protein [Streptomyces sp. AC558_RSS880]|uniref:ATP-binding protein n=1 Tax=Streptomyces sp. AC558_RSS880 TaxID=2823687 RepID=UPI001C24EB5B|nr:ATP-binding protein [Streptomyces sp. AC558_RSS880]